MSLPWDELQPVEPELPYEPPDPVVVIPPADGGPGPGPKPPARPVELSGEMLEAMLRDLKDEALDYVKASWELIRKGETVDVLHPTITAETKAGRELVVADARSRSWRTLVQGLAIDLFAAVLAVLATLSGADPFVKETWLLIGALLIKTVIQSVAAYFMRLKVTPTIRTPGEKMALMPIPRPMMEEKP